MKGDSDAADTSRDTVPAQSLRLESDGGGLAAAWSDRGVEPTTSKLDRGGTLVREREAGGDRSAEMRRLPSFLLPGPEGSNPQLELGAMIGEGGMGVVWQATQPALDRTVAVKSLREDMDPKRGAPQLLREARVTGVLEHPNVIPIYALGRDDAERPLLVMKRIEGRTWRTMLGQATPESRHELAYLREHLNILEQVALAAHYAHSKGVIHRDLKSDNVMIGGFGEVYVMDWGIAVSLREDGVRDIPLARDIRSVEGTPAYLAPEMAAGNGSAIDERSDVYLLGALLHEVLTGAPPHTGPTLMAMLVHAFASEPPVFDAGVPRGLTDICRKAMARDPADRYSSAAELVDAIDDFILRRTSLELTEEAEQRLAVLVELLGQGAERNPETLYATFSACRFAFEQARKSWPENEVAASGLERALVLMIEFELSRDAPAAAQALIGGLRTPDAQLVARVEAALTKGKEGEARLRQLERDADLTFGVGLRRVVIVIVAVIYGLACIACGLADRYDVLSFSPLAVASINGGMTLLLLSSAVLRRRTLLGNVANRRLTVTAIGAFATYTLLWSLAYRFELPLATAVAIHALVAVATWGDGAINLDRRWAPVPVSSACTLVAALIAPAYALEWLGLFALLGGAAAAWLHREPKAQDHARSSTSSRELPP